MMRKVTVEESDKTPSELISAQISALGDWRGEKMAQLRKIIREADPDMAEEWKWGTAAWSHNGMVCSAAAFKDHVRLNFFNGAALTDPQHLFNAGLEAKTSRGIDIRDGDKLAEAELRGMVQRAVEYNLASGR